jgi:iron(III) transport system ATP-binding protein
MEYMIECHNLIKRFGETVALDNVNLNVNKHEIIAIIGPSGCGKTTLLRCIAGLERPDRGRIIMDGDTVFDSDKGIFVPPDKRGIGMVFQIFAVWPHMTVFENIAYPLKLRKMPKDEIERRVKEVIELVNLQGLENRYPHQLSGGQQQRISLGRALVMQPKVILFDEPMSNLDAKLAEKLKIDIRILVKNLKITAVYVTHDQLEALTVADRIAVMRNGRILEIGPSLDIYKKPKNTFTAEFVGVSNKIRGKVVKFMNSYIEIETQLGKLVCDPPYIDVKPNEEVVMYIRASDIDIYPYPGPAEKRNAFEGRIKSRSFTGDSFIYIVEVNGAELRVHAPADIDIEESTKVVLVFDPSKVIVLKGGE